jgi:2-polyprenyl-3-methyl-5-hydroxy-6-metoxy-1,4-benzoquinol methylase
MTRRLRHTLKRQFTRLPLRGIHFSDRYDRLDLLYRVRDPWEMETEQQRYRFRETNRLIEANFGHVGRILEVGSGEGHQSEELLRVCDELVGIDVSARAVERARERCPQATFGVGDVFDDELVGEGRSFDLVVGCEVLYYMKDVPAALDRFSALGRACLVSYYAGPAKDLDPQLSSIEGLESETIHYEDARWKVSWWRNAG